MEVEVNLIFLVLITSWQEIITFMLLEIDSTLVGVVKLLTLFTDVVLVLSTLMKFPILLLLNLQTIQSHYLLDQTLQSLNLLRSKIKLLTLIVLEEMRLLKMLHIMELLFRMLNLKDNKSLITLNMVMGFGWDTWLSTQPHFSMDLINHITLWVD